MNQAQEALYWREWGLLTKRCKKEGWAQPDRHELHERALKVKKSHKDFSNADFDKVLGIFRSYSQAENLNAQVRQERMGRTRLEHRIKIEQMRLLALLLSEQVSESVSEWVSQPEKAPANAFVLDLEAAWNYFVPVAEIHGGPDLSLVSDEPIPRPNGQEMSDLELLRDTLDDRLKTLRQKRVARVNGLKLEAYKRLSEGTRRSFSHDSGWNWHDVNTAAEVPCFCAACKKKAKPSPTGASARAQKEEVVA